MSELDLPVFSDPIATPAGHFVMKWGKGCPEVPCRLWRDEVRDEVGDLMEDVRYHAAVDTESVDPADPPRWPWTRIPEQQWRYLTDRFAWCRQWEPDGPEANPKRPIRQSTVEFL